MSHRSLPGLGPEFCEECGTEMENDIDYDGKGVSTCPNQDNTNHQPTQPERNHQ